jgi:hypothetical protein
MLTWTQRRAFLDSKSEEQLSAQQAIVPTAPPARGTTTGQYWDTTDAFVKRPASSSPAAKPILTTPEHTVASAGRGRRARHQQARTPCGRAQSSAEGPECGVDEDSLLGPQGDADNARWKCCSPTTAGRSRVHGLYVGYGRRVRHTRYVPDHPMHSITS